MVMRRFWRGLQAALAPLALFGAAAHADPIAERIGDGIVRFWPDATTQSSALPSVALQAPLPSLGPAPEGFKIAPAFTSEGGGHVVRIATGRGTSLYGAGEIGGRLEHSGRTIVCWNTDAYAYNSQSPSLYQSHPWVLGVRADGTSFGVLADTPNRLVMDLSHGIEFRAQGPGFAVIVIERPTPQAVVQALADLTGHMPLPPRWAIGFQQCRYSYAPATEVERIAREFRSRDLPCDVLWMDIDYMDQHRSFTFDPVGFANPKGLADTLHSRGFRSVWILDPHIRQEPGYEPYDQGTKYDYWVEMPDGSPYVGKVWPGMCVFPDFTRRDVRAWWGGMTAEFVQRSGADGIWNDMNEPAVFDVTSKTMELTARHEADPELGGPGFHTRYHNIYGMQMARATWDGLHGARPNRRPFVLSRANHIGGQRFAAAWTGDNRSNDEHLLMALPMVLNLGLSAQPFAGPDIGGYAEACTGDQFAKWFGMGALFPFSRAHAEKGNIRKEPWSFGPRVEALCRRALQTRYRLLPYLYTVFEEAARTGLPVARPAFFADPRTEWVRTNEHEFLLGGDLLARVDLEDVADPNQRNLSDDAQRWPRATVVEGPDERAIPALHLRAGAIVPLGPVMAYSDEKPLDEIELLVALDAHGHAEGVLYEDAGDGYGYQKGEFSRTHFSATREGDTVRVKLATHEGTWAPPAGRHYRVTLLGGQKLKVVGP
jgi:alpha-glucosidase